MTGLANLVRRFLRGDSTLTEDRRLLRALLADPGLQAVDPGAPSREDYGAMLDRVAARLPELESRTAEAPAPAGAMAPPRIVAEPVRNVRGSRRTRLRKRRRATRRERRAA